MMSALEAAIRIAVDLLVRGKFDVIEAMTRSRRMTASEIESSVRQYGCRLVDPPVESWFNLDVVPIDDVQAASYSVVLPLWTLEEGRSDLSLELTLTEFAPGLFVTEIDGVRVR